jgi:hypothetical protein
MTQFALVLTRTLAYVSSESSMYLFILLSPWTSLPVTGAFGLTVLYRIASVAHPAGKETHSDSRRKWL